MWKKEAGKYRIFASYMPTGNDEMTYREMIPTVVAEMMKTSNDICYVKDRNGRYLSASRTCAQALGLQSAAELLGKTDEELFDPDTAARYRREDTQVMESGEPLLDQVENLRAENGLQQASSTSKYPLCDQSGKVIGLYGIGHNITGYREELEKLTALIRGLPGGAEALSRSAKTGITEKKKAGKHE